MSGLYLLPNFAGSSTLPRTGRVVNGTGMVDKVTAATSSTSLYDNVAGGTGVSAGTGVSGGTKQTVRQMKDRETTTAGGKASTGPQLQNVAVGTGSQTDEVRKFPYFYILKLKCLSEGVAFIRCRLRINSKTAGICMKDQYNFLGEQKIVYVPNF